MRMKIQLENIMTGRIKILMPLHTGCLRVGATQMTVEVREVDISAI